MYAEDTGLDDYAEPRAATEFGSSTICQVPLRQRTAWYTTIFKQKMGDNDLLGLSCYMPKFARSNAAFRRWSINCSSCTGGKSAPGTVP